LLSRTDQIAWLRQLLLALPDGNAAHVTAVHRQGGDGYGAMEADACWQHLLLTSSLKALFTPKCFSRTRHPRQTPVSRSGGAARAH
jgi:hypothetical protein